MYLGNNYQHACIIDPSHKFVHHSKKLFRIFPQLANSYNSSPNTSYVHIKPLLFNVIYVIVRSYAMYMYLGNNYQHACIIDPSHKFVHHSKKLFRIFPQLANSYNSSPNTSYVHSYTMINAYMWLGNRSMNFPVKNEL